MKLNCRFVVLFFVTDPLDYSHNISRVLKSPGCESLLLVTSACGVHLRRPTTTHNTPAELESHSYSVLAKDSKLHILCLASSHAYSVGNLTRTGSRSINIHSTVITPVYCLLNINNIRPQRQGLSRGRYRKVM